ncbi:MAG TPA: M28 family peptidase [Longimicrobium sp.]|nr:M28 family peptidase [Longimicrobium sp.]
MRHARLLPSAALALALALAAPLGAQVDIPAAIGGTATPPPAFSAIREADLRRDLAALAADTFRGREAGTLDELRASAWLAERARQAGMLPAGEDGTYFQFFPMRRVRMSGGSRVSLGARALALGRDAVVLFPTDAAVDAPMVWVGTADGAQLAAMDLRGKAVVARLVPPRPLPPRDVGQWAWRYTWDALGKRVADLGQHGAAAIVLVSDSVADTAFDALAPYYARGSYELDSAGVEPARQPYVPVVWVRGGTAGAAVQGQRLTASLSAESFTYPSVNVVAQVPGTDSRLKNDYVLFSAHQDHDGLWNPTGADSTWNGADDNATGSVALLAIGRAFARQPGRRTALFVWHGAEERGLLGSHWYVRHPTVPRAAIVAVLNADMIGRNHPDTAALLGVSPPHRNSRDLVQVALDANTRASQFVVDSTWDRPTHPELWYFRSDHLPYARAGIPAIFYSTLPHPDYHTPRDEAQRIGYPKLTRMTRWMYATGWALATSAGRPRVDPGFRLER